MARAKRDWKAEWEQIAAESRKLAKRANQRMVRLERYARERPEYAKSLSFAYRKAQQHIKNVFGKDASRYKEHIKLYDIDGVTGSDLYKANVMIQRQRIKEMEEFLGSESSVIGESRAGKKVKGLKHILDKRTEWVNSNIRENWGDGLEFSDNDLKRFFDSKKQAKLEKLVGSDLMFVVASVIKKNKLKSNKRDFKKFLKEHIDLKETGLTERDLQDQMVNGKKESFTDMLDRLDEFIRFTDDEVLDDKIKDALRQGININNIFI